MGNGVEELNVSKDGVSIKSFQMNTLLTLVAVLFSGASAGGIYFHMNHTRDAFAAFTAALKEQTVAMREQTQVAREQNCLMQFEQGERRARAEICKTVTR